MPRGPRGEKRPADVIGAAVMVGRIATGEIEEAKDNRSASVADAGRKGGQERARKLSPQKRKEIAQKAARGRWRDK